MKRKKIFIGSIIIFVMVIVGLLIFNSLKPNDEIIDKSPTDMSDKIPIEPNEKTAKLTLVGDFLYEEPYYVALKAGEDKDKYFSKVKDYFQNDDLSIGNMEVPIDNGSLGVSGTGFSFCAPQSIGHSIIDLGMDVLATTNNHANDRGVEGRISTIDFFKNNSEILTVGTYKDGERDVLLNKKTVNDISFGFLAYSYGTNVRVPLEYRNGIGLYNDPDGKDHDQYIELMKNEIKMLRKEVDVLIVIMHWGVEFTYTPKEYEQDLAQMMNELGVDIIVGSHSHSIQPIEWIRSDKHDTLVYYSMGNFVSADDDISRTGETFDNAYQMGLLSTLNVVKEEDRVYIKDIDTEPIINYYDNDMRNFMLVPFDQYDDALEKSHYRYKYNFNRHFIKEAYERVISSEFRR